MVTGINGYQITQMPATGLTAMPLAKTVIAAPGAWLANYGLYPWMKLAPIAVFTGAVLAVLLSRLGWPKVAFIASGVAVAAVT